MCYLTPKPYVFITSKVTLTEQCWTRYNTFCVCVLHYPTQKENVSDIGMSLRSFCGKIWRLAKFGMLIAWPTAQWSWVLNLTCSWQYERPVDDGLAWYNFQLYRRGHDKHIKTLWLLPKSVSVSYMCTLLMCEFLHPHPVLSSTGTVDGKWAAPLDVWYCSTSKCRGHGGRVVTLSPPTSEAGVRSPWWP